MIFYFCDILLCHRSQLFYPIIGLMPGKFFLLLVLPPDGIMILFFCFSPGDSPTRNEYPGGLCKWFEWRAGWHYLFHGIVPVFNTLDRWACLLDVVWNQKTCLLHFFFGFCSGIYSEPGTLLHLILQGKFIFLFCNFYYFFYYCFSTH